MHAGDTLQILALKDTTFLVQISRMDEALATSAGKASEWVLSARGSVRHAANEAADDVRMAYYAAKYGLK